RGDVAEFEAADGAGEALQHVDAAVDRGDRHAAGAMRFGYIVLYWNGIPVLSIGGEGRPPPEAPMALAGEGAVAIWHDLAPEGRAAFHAWHGEEHMPERVGIPGFLRGRRYVALSADLEYFNLYEALSPQVLTGADYQSRLNAPTPW